MQHETLLEHHNLLQHELTHAKTVAEAAAEGAQYYRAQLDESTFRQQAAEGHVVQLQQSIAKLQRDATAEKSLLQSLQSVCTPIVTSSCVVLAGCVEFSLPGHAGPSTGQ